MTSQLPLLEEPLVVGRVYVVIERKGHKLCIAPGSLPDWAKKGWRQVGTVKG